MAAKILSVRQGEDGTLVELDPYGEIACKADMVELMPLVGLELDDEGEAELLRTLTMPALEAGAYQLGMRALTRKKLVEKLVEKGHDPFLAERAADKLEEMGAVDDAEYARMFAQDRAARGWGEIRIRAELRNRGVDEDYIDCAIGELESSEDAIEAFIISKCHGEPLDRKAAKKISDALARKGFRRDEISPILRRYMED